ncbi:MAG TPA: MATE family efflux transporter [Firmicutes bacterium]|nr:MATE family efflux transporter [Bacillota bacterium]
MKSYEMDMCSGPLFKKIVRFLVPLILSGVLQLMFNAADMIVVGQFTGSKALAAVGATTFLINLQVNLFIGISIGANVAAAKSFGAKNDKDLTETVHTAVLMAIVIGVLMIFIGNLVAEPVLRLMGTPDDVIGDAVLYIRIYFCGMPALMLYNFGAAILRAVGDTKRPLYFLTLAGVINVIFNLFFVIVFDMGVAGVAIATVISQAISAILVLYCLCRSEGTYRLYFRRLHIYPDKFFSILKVGLSAGFQSFLFNIANIMVQSSVNSFGSLVMAGNTAANNIEGFVYVTISSTSQTSISFISQNMGAKQYKRVKRIFWECVGITTVVAGGLGVSAYLFAPWLLRLYNQDPQVITYGITRLSVVAMSYALNGIQDVMASSFRGMGSPLMPMVVSLTGICLIRILWVLLVFPLFRTREVLYLAYPVSWGITIIMNLICYQVIRKKRLDPYIAEAAR